jgi:lysophospholipase L1-like esterase
LFGVKIKFVYHYAANNYYPTTLIMKKNLLLIAAYCLFTSLSLAQAKHNFWDDVQTIKTYDKIYEPRANPIVFVGSSSIRKWADLQQAFGSYNVMNRGVGGEIIDDCIFYLDDMVFAYKPRQIVLYVGENDLPNEKNTADSVFNKTVVLYKLIRAKLPETPIVYISFKPSPSRDKYQQKAATANKMIQQFLAKEKNTVFVDIYTPMLKDGKSRPELFVGDMLHMNQQGYDIWDKAVKPYLLKNDK